MSTRTTPSSASQAAPRTRHRVAMVSSTGEATRFNAELQSLLRSRLRTAAVIFGAGCLLFFIKSLFYLGDPFGPTPVGLALHGLTVLVAASVAVLLSTPRPLSLDVLRWVELAFFGSAALMFVWHHFTTFADQVPPLHLELETASQQGFTFNLIAAALALRWLILVVIYGTFIPNTWRRCATVVSILAGLPVLLTLVTGFVQPLVWPHLPEVLIATVLMMGIAAAVAVFGSYKISELHQKALEAEYLGQYKLLRPLGLGGMGEVYLAQHTLLSRQCAVKVIRPDQVSEPSILTRFEREVQSTARLTHPNTVEIYDYGRDDDGTFYYVMEYLPGLSLEVMVEKYGPLPPGRAVRFLRQLCGALREAHEQKIIHRDVKPSNVLVCERGGVPDVAKLLDFGLVQRPPVEPSDLRLTMHGTVLGSPPYMAPEQAAGKDVDARGDIYCLGGVAYFLLTGQPPFVRETTMQMMLAHAYETPKPLRELRPEVPEDLERVVLKCLEKDPDNRFQDTKSLEKALAACDCADDWSDEQARTWWKDHPFEEPAAAPTQTANVGATA